MDGLLMLEGYVGIYGVRVPEEVKTNHTTLIHYIHEVA